MEFYYKVVFMSGDQELVVVTATPPGEGDTLDSACTTLDHHSPDFCLFNNVTVDEILSCKQLRPTV